MDKQDAGDIRGLCVKPQKHQNKWNVMTIDKSGQAAACEWLEQHNAESFVKLQAEVATLNGLDCLNTATIGGWRARAMKHAARSTRPSPSRAWRRLSSVRRRSLR